MIIFRAALEVIGFFAVLVWSIEVITSWWEDYYTARQRSAEMQKEVKCLRAAIQPLYDKMREQDRHIEAAHARMNMLLDRKRGKK